MRSQILRRVRWLPLLLAPAVLLLIAGCDHDTSQAASSGTLGPEQQAPARIQTFTVNDLPASMNLTADQETRMNAAITRLNQARDNRVRGFRGRRGQPGEAAAGAPMMQFLTETSNILTPDQFATFASFLADRRGAALPGMQAMGERFLDNLPRRAAKALDLTKDQQESLRSTLQKHAGQFRQVHQSLRAGTITPEQARDQAGTIRKDLMNKVQSILTPDQWAKVERFRQERSARWASNRLERVGDQIGRQIGFLANVLALSPDQKEQAARILQGTVPQRRAVLERVKNGAIAPEDTISEMTRIEKAATGQIRSLLTPDQTTRFDALSKLVRPGSGLGMGPGRHPGMGPGAGRGMGRGGPAMPRRGWKS